MKRALPLLLALASCTPGPGRQAMYLDAEVHPDAFFPDARADAGFADTGVPDSSISLPDGGPLPQYPMTGIFGIVGDRSPVYAREVNGRLNLVIGAPPYIYTGTIAASGAVRLESRPLAFAGCQGASVTGTYDRSAAFYVFRHDTCGGNGARLNVELRGGFDSDYDPRVSGVYEVSANVSLDAQGCARTVGERLVRWAINVIPGSNAASVFTAVDAFEEPTLYLGTFTSANGNVTVLDPTFNVSLTGSIVQPTANDQPTFRGRRDVVNPERGCSYTVTFEGHRIAFP